MNSPLRQLIAPPLPHPRKYHFKTMEIGDGYVIECAPSERRAVQNRVSSASLHYAPRRFTVRCVDSGVGYWRVA